MKMIRVTDETHLALKRGASIANLLMPEFTEAIVRAGVKASPVEDYVSPAASRTRASSTRMAKIFTL